MFGIPCQEPSAMESYLAMINEFSRWYHASPTSYGKHVHERVFERQARILLKPSLFDTPNEFVKIFAYQHLSADEARGLEHVGEYLLSRACHGDEVVSAQVPTTVFKLLGDMRQYHMCSSTLFHGNLYQHSLWTVHALDELLSHAHPWAVGLCAADQHVLRVAALLHDIGDAGDGVYCCDVKPDHALIGCEYLRGERPYKVYDGSTLDMTVVLRELSVTSEQCDVLLALIASHNVLRESLEQVDDTARAKMFVDKLRECCSRAGICVPINPRLVRMVGLLGLANIVAYRDVVPTSTWLRALVGDYAKHAYKQHEHAIPIEVRHDECSESLLKLIDSLLVATKT